MLPMPNPPSSAYPVQVERRFLSSNGRQQRIVDRALEFMRSHLNQRLLTEELCRAVEVSQRTLRYAFRDVLGQGPMAYFKTQKLNAVRQALKKADPKGGSVHEIGLQWGFEHTGHFAADYYRLFGEKPSETLGK
jgi:AraC family transcriptional regulator, ethanolamine operon transcriptional activator